jgi:uncharacterized membrane protein YfcA
MTMLEALGTCALGLAAGVVGGLAGVGGSMVMLPGLHLLNPRATGAEHHMFMAAAMTVNVAVAIPAALRHAKAGALRRDLLPSILAAAVVTMILGVLVSNLAPEAVLKVGLAVFILGYCAMNLRRLATPDSDSPDETERTSRGRLLGCGGCAGAAGGLLGLGGGVVLVPMLQIVCRLPLRQAIATSAGVISVTAVIGAAVKLGTLDEHGMSIIDGLRLAVLMAPTAIVGGRVGAWLTHAMPLKGVRLAVTVLLMLAASNLIRTSL